MNSIPRNHTIEGPWQLIIKVAGVLRKRARRSAYAYEARNMQGEVMFTGVASSAAGTASGAAQEALMEAVIKARNFGFRRALFLSNCNRLVQVCNKESAPHWQEKTMIADLLSLQQNGLVSKLCFVPKAVLGSVCHLLDMATRMPIHQGWSNPALLCP